MCVLLLCLPLLVVGTASPVAAQTPCMATDVAVTAVIPDTNDAAGRAALAADCATLLGLKDTLRGTADLNWAATLSMASWEGLTIETGRVSRLVLLNKSLTGTIPAALGHLTALRNLNLAHNQLTGSIPALSSLTSLGLLSLQNNRLSGSIPALSSLTSLQSLTLAYNQLTGSIPALSSLTSLGLLNLQNNRLSGSLPALSGLTSLQSLNLNHNQLTGSLPALSGLTSLQSLNLNDNHLSGSLPALSGLPALQFLFLHNNQLTGSLPALSDLPVLTRLNLKNNQLTGSLPALSDLPALTSLDLRDNRLSGSIPALSLPALTSLSLDNNQLTGSLPALSGLPALTSLSLQNNRLSGSLPSSWGNLASLWWLSLQNNRLSGSIPLSWGNLTNLRSLNLQNNRLSGSIPALSGLDSLLLDRNQLSGGIPAALGTPPVYLADLSLCANDLDANARLPDNLERARMSGYLTVWTCLRIDDAEAAEGQDLVFRVELDTYPVPGSSSATPVTVGYTVDAGTATAGSDYGATGSNVTIPANTDPARTTSHAEIRIPTIDDSAGEGAETLSVTVMPPQSTVAVRATATGTIAASGLPVVSFVRAAESVGEAIGIRGVRVAVSETVVSPLSITYSVDSASTATEGLDYILPASRTIEILESIRERSIEVTVLKDSEVGGYETVILTLDPGSGYIVGTPATHTLTIIDDEGGGPPPPPPITGGGGSAPGGGGSATVRDTHGNCPAQATVVALPPPGPITARGHLISARDVDCLSFTLPHPGLVIIESQSSHNPRGRLLDTAETELATDDDSGRRRNFRLATAVSPGVHYLAVDSPTGSTGPYALSIDYRPGYLEIPWADAIQSGIGVLSGWVCGAERVDIEIEKAAGDIQTIEAAYGTAREVAVGAICGDSAHGYGALFNWNELGAGAHTVRAVVDGVVLAEHAVTVVPLGPEPFVRGLRGQYTLDDFPQTGATTSVVWSERLQSFVIAAGDITLGAGDTAGHYPQLQFENPGAGTYQSGVGVLSGWVCEAETVEVLITPDTDGQPVLIQLRTGIAYRAGNASTGPPLRVSAAYGTEREAAVGDLCGDSARGFGALFNWNVLGDGVHVVELLVDGEAVAQSTIRVTTLGGEFVRGLQGTYVLEGFPTLAETTTVEWQQNLQNFGIVAVE